MFNIFYMGGPLFMGILSILLMIVVVVSILFLIKILNKQFISSETFRFQLKYVKQIGLFALVTGILGQLIGLYDAFVAIEKAGDIAQSMIFGGLKVSMITTLYGIFIYLLSLLFWFILSLLSDRSQIKNESPNT